MRTKISFFVAVLTLALILTACSGSASSESTPPNLSVSGTGTVSLTPDIAYIYIGVHTDNTEISQAVSDNNAKAQAVIAALRAAGIEDKDIQTSNYSLWSSQQYDPMTGQPTATVTYNVDNTVQVKVRDLTKLPSLLDTAVKSGANNINSISFDVADKTEALKQARKLAVDNAKALAEELANDAGVTLGDIYNISYTEYTPSLYSGYGMGGGAAPEAAAAPINPGQLQLTVNVSITYVIKK